MAEPEPKAKKEGKSKGLDPEEQRLRFVKTAKDAEADESPNALDKAFHGLNVRNKGSPKKPK